MSTGIVHGDPGSFKTATLINDYLVPAVRAGRVVVTNIRGVKTREEIADIYNFELPDEGEIIYVSFDEAGFEQMARFFHWAPLGALILMDEGQRVYPTRLKDFKQYDYLLAAQHGRPATVEDAFDSHRHMNWDIYISTPNINKIHREIRAVAEFGYRHKNLATVFSFIKGRYKRVTHIADNAGTSVSSNISTALRKIDVRCFNVYQSTATGKTKDSTASFSFIKQPKVLLLLCILAYTFWNFGSTIYRNGGLPAMFGGHSKAAPVQTSVQTAVVSSQASSAVPAHHVSKRVITKNPFAGLTFYYVGDLPDGMLFEVNFPDTSVLTLKQRDLKVMGFTVVRLNSSIAQIIFNDEATYAFTKPNRPLIPQQQFTNVDQQTGQIVSKVPLVAR